MSDHWRSSRIKRFQVAAIAGLGYPLINALGHTLRWRVEGLQHLDAIQASGRRPVMGFWHGRILPATFYFRRRGIVVITSENFDGEWIARIIERFGYGTARGSTSRGGLKAMLQLKREMKEGEGGGVYARRTARSRASCAGRCRVARQRDGQSRAPVSPRGLVSLASAQLGPHADSEAVQDGGAGGRRADGCSTGCVGRGTRARAA